MTNTIDEKLKEFEPMLLDIVAQDWSSNSIIASSDYAESKQLILDWLKQALEEVYEEGLIDDRDDVEVSSDTKMPPPSSRKVRVKLLGTNNDQDQPN